MHPKLEDKIRREFELCKTNKKEFIMEMYHLLKTLIDENDLEVEDEKD